MLFKNTQSSTSCCKEAGRQSTSNTTSCCKEAGGQSTNNTTSCCKEAGGQSESMDPSIQINTSHNNFKSHINALLSFPYTTAQELKEALSTHLYSLKINPHFFEESDLPVRLARPIALRRRTTIAKGQKWHEDNGSAEKDAVRYETDSSSEECTGVPGSSNALELSNFDLNVESSTLLSSANLFLRKGEIYGLIGHNGIGKTTLLKYIKKKKIMRCYLVKQEQRNKAKRFVSGAVNSMSEKAVGNNSMNKGGDKVVVNNAMNKAGNNAMNRTSDNAVVNNAVDKTDENAMSGKCSVKNYLASFDEQEVIKMLVQFGFKDHEKDVKELSGGWLKKLELIKGLLSNADLLMLDEPTNMLDLPSIDSLEKEIATKGRDKIVLMVSHDISFLNNLCTHIIQIENKELRAFKGNYDEYRNTSSIEKTNKAKLIKKNAALVKKVKGLADRFRCNAKWAGMVQSKLKMIRGLETEEEKECKRVLEVKIEGGMRGNIVKIEGLDIYYMKERDGATGSKEKGNLVVINTASRNALNNKSALSNKNLPGDNYLCLFNDLNFIIKGNSKMLIVGPNGAGKSTLLNCILNDPLVYKHPNLKIEILSQHHYDNFREGERVIPYLLREIDKAGAGSADLSRSFNIDDYNKNTIQHIRSVLSTVNLKKDFQFISTLSGGEKTRLILSKMIIKKPDLILLDEPTNHLDIEGIEGLKDVIKSFPGAVLCVSHDLYFCSNLFDSVWVVDGGLKYFKGSVEEYKRGIVR